MPLAVAAAPAQPGIGCAPISLNDWLMAICKGVMPQSWLQVGGGRPSDFLKDLVCFASALGALEPLSALRPAANELVMVFDKTYEIPPATMVDGKLVPGEAKLIRICAGMGKALVVDKLRALPANLTAVQSGSIIFKKLAVFGFSEGFCPAGEPGDQDELGTYQNIEHIIFRPESGFDLYGRNFDLFSTALIHVHARMWAAC